MSLSNPLPRATRASPIYACDGVNATFGVPFWFLDALDLVIVVTAGAVVTTYQEGAGYTATGAAQSAGGAVTLGAPPALGATLQIFGRRTPSRLTSVFQGGVVNGVALDLELDTLEATLQELRRDIDASSPPPASGAGSFTGLATLLLPSGVLATDTAAIEAASINLAAANGGEIVLAAGLWRVSQITPRSRVRIRGVGVEATTVQLTGTVCVNQPAGSHIYAFGLSDVTIKADGGSSAATAIKITSMQFSRFDNLVFRGFAAGRLLDIAAATPSALDPNAISASANIIFNRFHNWRCYDACANPMRIAGKYGTTPTPSPANSSPYPAIVVTKNTYDDLQFFTVTGTGLDIVRCCDSEVMFLDMRLAQAGAVALNIGSDPDYTGNTYVNAHHIYLTFAAAAGLATMTLLKSNCFSFGTRLTLEHDQNPAQAGFTLYDIAGWQSYEINGKCLNTFHNAQDMTVISDGLFYLAKGHGSALTPPYAFLDDFDSGLYLSAVGVPAIAANGFPVITFNGQANAVNFIAALNAATGGGPGFYAQGADANVSMIIQGKGTAGGLLRTGAGVAKIAWDGNGVGFNGTTPIAKPAVTGSRGGNAALASLLTALASYGLLTDSTTA
ncbi:hypothetical protein [Methylocystis sp.]|uniref:hypothetical protein n=1 Tax=Methylocystis sp. TaxID=1911079 RepID=UPI002735437C|nr:hypothetical protein [Methylocystis sp.]MDP3554820.1 hypothetical protein [Methylocystis sp.]